MPPPRRLPAPRSGRDFPRLGHSVVATPATTTRWFVTAHTSRWRRDEQGWTAWPGSTVHAKQMGSLTTACGQQSQTWPKFWHLSFPLVGSDVCVECRRTTHRAGAVRSGDPRPPHGA